MRKQLFVIVLIILASMVTSETATFAVPPEFEDTLVAEIDAPTDVAWTPDGRILIPVKGGQLYVIENDVLLPTPVIDLSGVMCTNGERALGGVAVHPDYHTNHYIYLYYTFNKSGDCAELQEPNQNGPGPVNRLSRFVLTHENTIDPAGEVVLFDTAPLFRDHHNGGDIEFGADGFMYVTVGDGGSQRFDWPQDPGQLFGKIVRLTDTGAIPPGNPYTGADSARCNVDGVPPAGSPAGTKCQEVFSSGLRNPFRFAFDPNASGTRFFINDVGQHTWEDISEGPVAGGNYGWPIMEGPCLLDMTTGCDPAVIDPGSNFIDPIHWDAHGPDGAAVTGGAFVPDGLWPATYDGAYLYADYVFGKIYQLTPGGSGCRTCAPPTSNYIESEFTTAESVVGMAFGPYGSTQALYYVTRGYGPQSIDGLRRIAFVGTTNRAPTAVATANPAAGTLPLIVQFDGSGSSDPDNDPLTYEWDFEGDGTPDSTAAAPMHTYQSAGTFFATLTVDDGQSAQGTTSIRIDAGNSPPVPVIATPADPATFAVGDIITLQGSATDPEDGPLPDTSLTWEVRQHHALHYHPFLDLTVGNGIVLEPAPEPEDYHAADNSYLEVLLTATDSSGLSTTVSRIVNPRKVDLIFNSVPSGLDLLLDGFPVTTPVTAVSWESHNLQVDAPDQTDSAGTSYNWLSWSDGGVQSHTIIVPPSPATYSATFEQTVSSVLTFAPTDDTYIKERSLDSNYGDDVVVKVDGSSVKDALLKFDVSGIGGASVDSAKLRLFVDNGSTFGGEFYLTSSTNWSQNTVTWATAPAGDIGPIGSLGSVVAGSWVEIDLTGWVTADGLVSIRAGNSPTSNGAGYNSIESLSGNAPELIITLDQAPEPDVTAPSAPGNLAATDVQQNQVTLGWDASTDNVGVVAYDIYRDGNPSPIDSVDGATTSYQDMTVVANTTYDYTVRARDSVGNESGPSNTATVTTPAPDVTAPSAPGNLTATDVQATSVTLSWDASTDNVGVVAYDIHRDGNQIGTVAGTTTTYQDSTVLPETSYQYEVRARDAAGNVSGPNSAVGVTTPSSPTQTFDIQRIGSTSTYQAVERITNFTYSGSLKFAVESGVADLKVSGGGNIFFGAGDFDLGSDWFEFDDVFDIVFAGQGIDVTFLRNNSSASTDTEPFDFVGATRITVRDMTISAGGPDRNTSDALDYDNGNDNLIERIKVTDARGDGIVFDGKNFDWTATGNVIRDCIIDGVSQDGIELLAASNNLIENCQITNVGKDGIRVNKSSTSADQANKPSNDNVIRNNYVENAVAEGIRVNSSNRNLITGNTAMNNGGHGIEVFSSSSIVCNDNIVELNTATGNQGSGLSIADPECNRTVVGDNDFTGNSSGDIDDNGTDTIFTSSDTEAPSDPTGLTTTSVLETQVTLTWNASNDNVGVVAYDIYRDGAPSAIDSVGGGTTSYQDTTVVADTTYDYNVQARDAAGNVSGPSNTVNVTTPPAAPDMTDPTVPGNLTATDVQPDQVTLGWDASTDSVGVVAYDIYRDGNPSPIDSVDGGTTSYQDTAVAANTTYDYNVQARDAAGNVSGPSNTANVTTPAAPSVLTFTPTDDTFVKESSPTRNYSSNQVINVDGSSKKDGLLRFDVSGIGAQSVGSVTLRLFVENGSPLGGNFYAMTDTNWNENTVTWASAPASGASLGSLGDVDAGLWYELDVTPLVSGDGPVGVRASSTISNGARYYSKEHGSGNAPELVIVLQ